MLRKWIIAWSVIMSSALAAAADEPVDQSSTQTVGSSTVYRSALDGDSLWFILSGVNIMFTVDRENVADFAAIQAAVKDAQTTNREVAVWFDPNTGQFNNLCDCPAFPAIRIRYMGKDIAAWSNPPIQNLSSGESALIRATAYSETDNYMEAINVLSDMLGPHHGYYSIKEIYRALLTDAHAKRGEGESMLPAGIDRDRYLASAAKDYEHLRPLLRNPHGFDVQLGDLYSDLGAYPEALKTYDTAPRETPYNKMWYALNRSTIFRQQGMYNEALAELDTFVKTNGAPNDGSFHHNRGYTLLDLRRWSEAIAEFSEALRETPDDTGGSMARACAYASSGLIEEAVADQETAVKALKEELALLVPTQALAFNYKRSLEILDQLKQTKPSTTVEGLCDTYWGGSDKPRERSSLLEPMPAVQSPI
jgi:tetratricopeptide (TPR) repeat protein